MIRIIVADDHPVVRAGIKEILAEDPTLRVTDEASSGYELLRKTREQEFDVIILDIGMPGIDGLDTLKQIKSEKPKARVLILTIHPEARYAVRCVRMGADRLPHQRQRTHRAHWGDQEDISGQEVHQFVRSRKTDGGARSGTRQIAPPGSL